MKQKKTPCRKSEERSKSLKVIHSKTPLPKKWSDLPGADKALLIADLKVRKTSKLKAKLLVFKTDKDLRYFWKESLGRKISKGCLGLVSQLGCEWIPDTNNPSKSFYEVDPVYFCVIGLILKGLKMEVICHEAVHAGIAYAKRTKYRNLWYGADKLDEENICYPSGRIAAAINKVLHEAKLYE